jgi:hypothetical protein
MPMDAVQFARFAGDEAKTRDLLAEVSDLVDQGALTALPFRSFPASRIDAAFRLVAGGKFPDKLLIARPSALCLKRWASSTSSIHAVAISPSL